MTTPCPPGPPRHPTERAYAPGTPGHFGSREWILTTESVFHVCRAAARTVHLVTVGPQRLAAARGLQAGAPSASAETAAHSSQVFSRSA